MPGPLRIRVEVTAGPAAGRAFEFDQPDTFLFGRSADARVSLPDDPYVSRHHFLLELSPPNARVTDLGSKNGTFVNRVRYGGTVAPRPGIMLAPSGTRDTRLVSGDEIVVGDTHMRVQIQVQSLCTQCQAYVPPEERPVGAAADAAVTCRGCRELNASRPSANLATIDTPSPVSPRFADARSADTPMEGASPAPSGPTPRATPPPTATIAPPSSPPDPIAQTRPYGSATPAAPPVDGTLGYTGVRRRQVLCVQCGTDVTEEVGLRGQVEGSEYVCHTCRAQVKAEPVRRLRALRERNEGGLDGPLSLDDYDLLEQVGEGGMAKVYRAHDKRNDRTVAIKVMLPDVASTPEGVRSFMREMDITRQLRHENIVDLMGFVKARGTYFLVMEFVEGNDLSNHVRKSGGRLGLAEFAPIMLGVLDGLGHAHRAHITVRLAEDKATEVQGIVHRDLKPSNIFLSKNGPGAIPKIADFGLAKAFRAAGLTDMTRPGEVSGTPGYWPREQLVHYRYLAPASDVFSAAAVFYEVLTGARIRQGFGEMLEACRKAGQPPGLAQYIQVICTNPTVPIRERDPRIPAPVAAVMDRALREGVVAGGPDQVRSVLGDLRYIDAAAFAEALRGAFREAGIDVR